MLINKSLDDDIVSHIELESAEIEYFKQILLAKKIENIGDVNSIENEALKKSRLDAAGDLSSMPIHMADIGIEAEKIDLAREQMKGKMEETIVKEGIKAIEESDKETIEESVEKVMKILYEFKIIEN